MRRLGLGEERLRIVPVGIDLEGFAAAERYEGNRAIGFMSNISREMGFGLLADAFMILKRSPEFADLTLSATGGFSDHRYVRSVLKDLEDSGIKEDVRIVPSFRRLDRIRFLSGLSLVCVPVIEGEAFGTFILEALAAGVPVVEPSLGGFIELLDATGGGRLYQPNTPTALAEALAEVLTRPDMLAEMGVAGMKAVRAAYTVDHMAAAMERAFELCVEETRKTR